MDLIKWVNISLMCTAFLPVVTYYVRRPKLNLFFKYLLASIFLSIFFDILGAIGGYIYKSNNEIYFTYTILNCIVLILLWQSTPVYNESKKRFIRIVGSLSFILSVAAMVYYGISLNCLLLLLSINVFLSSILALLYFYQKLQHVDENPLIKDPYLIVASAFIIFNLSTLVVLAVQSYFVEHQKSAWMIRQVFYGIYNCIIAYTFYSLSLKKDFE